MRNFPPEIIDIVIDNLAQMFRTKVPQRDDDISKYSTISKSWRDRTQFHHFNQLVFWGQEGLDRWRAATAADPNGISRHVRSLVWWEIETLEGFGDHILAFTKVEATSFESCTIFRSLSGLSLLKPLGSSLLCLDINGENSPEGVTWFLTFLPHLRRFDSLANCVSDPHERSPFFKGLRNKLTVTALHARGSPEAVNGWISSSDLKHLHFNLHSPLDDPNLGPLDLSGYTSLETLQLPVAADPRILAETVGRSISSSELSTIVLELCTDDERVDPQNWKTLGEHLCRLARRFKVVQDGRNLKTKDGRQIKRKMVVEIGIPDRGTLLTQFETEQLMPGLDEEATILIRNTGIMGIGRVMYPAY